MQRYIAQFLRHLQIERGASPYTLKSYREDLTAFAEYFTETDGSCPEPAAITSMELRGFLSAMHEAGYAKTSIARKLASLRSFYRFGQRDGWAKTNPADGAPQSAEIAEAAALSFDRRSRQAAWRTPRVTPRWRCAIGPFSKRCTRRVCA